MLNYILIILSNTYMCIYFISNVILLKHNIKKIFLVKLNDIHYNKSDIVHFLKYPSNNR